MNNRLDLNQQERISRKYHEHPLLKACQSAFFNYQAGMNMLLFSPVEVFVEAVDVIDTLFEDGTDRETYICGLWNTLTIKYKLWLPGTPNEEVQTAVCSVFYAAAVSLSVCDEPYFKDNVKEALLDKVYMHKSIVRQEEDEVIVRLASFADELKEWMSVYEVSDTYLSDEIKDALLRKNDTRLKAITTKVKGKTVKENTTSFNYSPKKVDDSSKNMRISEVFSRLKAQKLIAQDTNQKHFLELFSGEKTYVKIVWTGETNMLHYIFDQWVRRGYLPKSKGGLWVALAARFLHRVKDENGDAMDVNFTNDEIRKSGNPKNPSDDIEQIIDMLKPDIRVRRFGE